MKRVKYNIEYAHIYADTKFGLEQYQSIQIVKKLIRSLDPRDIALSILIDEYNPKFSTLDEEEYFLRLEKEGAAPHFLVRESNLASLWKFFYQELSLREQKGVSKFIDRTSKLPCSFLIGLWNLRRLGAIKPSVDIIEKIGNQKRAFEGDKVINILPKKYASVEARAMKYIESTRFKNEVENIEHIYF